MSYPRITFLLFTAILAIAILPATASAQTNLLGEPGFETTAAAWHVWDDAQVEAWAARSGSNGLAMFGWTDGGGVYQTVFKSGVASYTFSAWGSQDADFTNTLAVKMMLEFKNKGDVTLFAVTNIVSGPAAWTEYSLSAISPPQTYVVRVVVAFDGLPGTGGAFKWDDLSLVASSPYTATLHVAPGASNTPPYSSWQTAAPNIQPAINAAPPGALVLVTNGFYSPSSQLVITNGITVRSIAGPERATISGSGVRRCFYVDHPAAVVEGFTITNGYAAKGVDSFSYGGGIYCRGGTIRSCIVTGNRLGRPTDDPWIAYGGGIYLEGGTVEQCRVAGNVANGGYATSGPLTAGTAYGGGIYACQGGLVRDCSIAENSLLGGRGNSGYYGSDTFGGGISMQFGGTVHNCIIEHNSAEGGRATGSQSHGDAFGGGAYIDNNAFIERSTIRANSAWGPYGDPSALPGRGFGGGVSCGSNGHVRSTRITGNATRGQEGYYGGSAFAGGVWLHEYASLQSSLIIGNSAMGGNGSTAPGGNAGSAMGGGVGGRGFIQACTIVDNSCIAGDAYYGHDESDGGGVYGLGNVSYANNIIRYNSATNKADIYTNTSSATFSDNCVPFDTGGSSNFVADPLFVDQTSGDYRLQASSPCMNAGLNSAPGGLADVDGYPRIKDGNVDIGAHESSIIYYVDPASPTPLNPYGSWSNAAHTIQEAVAAADDGDLVLVADAEYVLVTHVLLDKAVTVRGFGGQDEVVVDGNISYHCFIITDPGATVEGIHCRRGWADQVYSYALGGGIYAPFGATIRNCTITEHFIDGNTADTYGYAWGAGLFMEGTGLVENCQITSNRAEGGSCAGGGMYANGDITIRGSRVQGNHCIAGAHMFYYGQSGAGGGLYATDGVRVEDCLIEENLAQGRSAMYAGSGMGGGVYAVGATVATCRILRNESRSGGPASRGDSEGYGGGLMSDGHVLVENCLVQSNFANGWFAGSGIGGGIFTAWRDSTTVIRCSTIVENMAYAISNFYWAAEGGGIYATVTGRLENCIVYDNVSVYGTTSIDNFAPAAKFTMTASCTTPSPNGTLNITNRPSFIDQAGEDFRLAYGSPCIDTGISITDVTTDLYGNTRPLDGDFDTIAAHDMGAYEYNPTDSDSDSDAVSDYDEIMVYYSSPTNMDTDGDGMGDGAEIIAGTSLTNSGSVLDMDTGSTPDWEGPGIVVRWSSVAGRNYTLLRSTDLSTGLGVMASSITATPPMNTFTDLTATAEGPYYYQVKVE